MAEDKGSSKGSGWGPFEVAIIILLLLGLLSQLESPKKISTQEEKPIKKNITTSVSAPVTPLGTCGLKITSPHALEKINNKILLSGKTNGCDWSSTDKVALYAQIIDSRGSALTDYLVISPLKKIREETLFNTTILISRKPQTSTGYLLLIPAQTVNAETKTLRIPISFTNHTM